MQQLQFHIRRRHVPQLGRADEFVPPKLTPVFLKLTPEKGNPHMSASSAPLPNETHEGTVGRIVGLAVAYDIGVFGLHLFNWLGAPISDTSVARYSGSIAIALCMMALLF